MSLILTVLVSLCARIDETYTVTLTFKGGMHCEECKDSLLESLKKLSGVKSADVDGAAVSVVIEEKSKFEYGKMKSACPRDLKLAAISVADLRGVVSETKGKLSLTAKASSQVFALVNPKGSKDDRLAALKKEMSGRNQFSVKGEAADASTLAIESFKKTEWK